MQRPGTFELFELGRKMGLLGSIGRYWPLVVIVPCHRASLAVSAVIVVVVVVAVPVVKRRGMFRLLSWFVILRPNPRIINGLTDWETSSCGLETSQDSGCRILINCV
jgi:hypothetical protein